MTPAKCKSCGAAIFWTKHKLSGRRNPVDAEPSPGGNLWLTKTATGELLNESAPADGDKRRNRWVSHFATCPDAKKHRRSAPADVSPAAETDPVKNEPRSGFYNFGDGRSAFLNFAPRGKKR